MPIIPMMNVMAPLTNTASTVTFNWTGSTANTTSIYVDDGASVCSTINNFTNCSIQTVTTAGGYVTVPVIFEVDEEDYVNHAEYYELARARGVAFRIRTAEERRRADEELARARAAAEAARREREAADLRSRELLFRHLTAEQRRTVEKNKWFVVVGGKSGITYRIRTDHGIAGNIGVMRGERIEATLCCHCSSDIPACDQFLAQKLALMWDEDNFLRTANRRAA